MSKVVVERESLLILSRMLCINLYVPNINVTPNISSSNVDLAQRTA